MGEQQFSTWDDGDKMLPQALIGMLSHAVESVFEECQFKLPSKQVLQDFFAELVMLQQSKCGTMPISLQEWTKTKREPLNRKLDKNRDMVKDEMSDFIACVDGKLESMHVRFEGEQ